jgi:hypothetical protein
MRYLKKRQSIILKKRGKIILKFTHFIKRNYGKTTFYKNGRLNERPKFTISDRKSLRTIFDYGFL